MGQRILRISDLCLAGIFGHGGGDGWRVKANPLPKDAQVVRVYMGGIRTVYLIMESEAWPEVRPVEMIPFVDPEPIFERMPDRGPASVAESIAAVDPWAFDGDGSVRKVAAALTAAYLEASESGSAPPAGETWRDRAIKKPLL